MSKMGTNKNTENNLKRLNAIFQSIPIPSYTWVKNKNDFELMDFNTASLNVEGDTLKDCLHTKASVFYKDQPNILADLKKCFKEKSTFKSKLNIKYTYIHPDAVLIQTEVIKSNKNLVTHTATDYINYQTVFIENSPAAIAMFDNDMRYLSVSNKWVEDYKLSGQQIIGRSHYDVFPEISQEWKDIHQHCLQGNIEKKEEDSFKRLDGSIDWIKWEVRPWYNIAQEVGGIVMLTENITQRKIAEEELRNSESKLIEAQKAAKIGSWETDLTTLNVIWSEETFNIFELDFESFNPTHQSFLSFVHPEDKQIVEKVFNDSLINSKGYNSIEHKIITSKGNLKYVEERWKVIKNVNGEINSVFGTCEDITERKLIEEELISAKKRIEISENRLQLSLDAAQIGIWEWNLADNSIIWDSKMYKIYGVSKKNIEHKFEAWANFLHPDDKEKTIKEIFEAVNNQNKLNTSFRIIKENGAIVHIKADALAISNSEGKPIKMIGLNKDITEQKELENKLKQYKHFFQNSNDFLNISNKDGDCEIVNPQMIKTLGYSEKEFLNNSFYDTIHPNDIIISKNEVDRLSYGEITNNFQIRQRKKNGEYIWIEWNVFPDEETGKFYSIGRDITESKRATELINYQFYNAPDIILIVNKNFKIERINRGRQYTKEELIGRDCIEVLPVESREIAKKAIIKCFETGENQEIENIIETGAWVRSRFVPMTIDGETRQIIIFATDISTEKQAKIKLLKSEEKYRNITENITDGIIVMDKDFKVTYRSPTNKKITGYADKELKDLDFMSMIHEEDRPKALEDLKRLPKITNKFEVFKLRLQHKKGHWIWIEGTIINMKKNNSNNAIVISFKDVTERIKSEEKLALSALIINSSDDAIISNTNNNFITSWNHGAEKIFGYSSEEIIGKSVYKLIPKNFYYEEDILSENIKLGQSVDHFETLRVKKDGTIINVSLTISPIVDEFGKVIGASKIIRDITSRKKLEQERKTIIDDLVQRNRDLEQFSYIVSHNLRAPVANIIGISSLLEHSELISKDNELLLGLSKSVHGLDVVIKDLNQILQMKREVNENKDLINFTGVLSEIKLSISNLISQENVKFIIDFSAKNEFFTIKSYLYSIFYNLISNSIKYKHSNRNPIIEIKSNLTENGFEIVYKDNGLGIDLEKKGEQVFGLYKRFHFHTDGKGMGLYMVKTQVETLGGHISIKSKVNVGTEFKIEFKN